jgi:hypothetical protein
VRSTRAPLGLALAFAASACSWVPDALKPETVDPVVPPPAGFVEASQCQAQAIAAPTSEHPAAVADKQGGWVALEFDLFGEGKPSNVRVVDSSPKGVFDRFSLLAMDHSTFTPTSERRVGCRYLITYVPFVR